MLKELFQREWRKVLATGWVLSITKSSRMVALESGLSFGTVQEKTQEFSFK